MPKSPEINYFSPYFNEERLKKAKQTREDNKEKNRKNTNENGIVTYGLETKRK